MIELPRASSHLDTTEIGHADVDNAQVGLMLFTQADSLEAVGCLGDDRMARLFE
jgi:hypothetical protein